jgi:hypothetical protein
MIRQLLFFGCLGFLFGPLQAQDPVFTQFYAAPVQLNPALTGSTLAPRIALNYRNQWPALNAYVTYAASYEQFVEEFKQRIRRDVDDRRSGRGL